MEVAGFLDPFRARGAAIADACTRCGDCFRACPMTGPAGIGDADPNATATAIVDLITGGARGSRCYRSFNIPTVANVLALPHFGASPVRHSPLGCAMVAA